MFECVKEKEGFIPGVVEDHTHEMDQAWEELTEISYNRGEEDVAKLLTGGTRTLGTVEFHFVRNDPVSEGPLWDGVEDIRVIGVPELAGGTLNNEP